MLIVLQNVHANEKLIALLALTSPHRKPTIVDPVYPYRLIMHSHVRAVRDIIWTVSISVSIYRQTGVNVQVYT